MGTQKYSFETYRKFGYAPLKRFVSHKPGYGLENPVFQCWKTKDTPKPALQQVKEFFLRMHNGRGVRLITYLHLVLGIRKIEC
jgi:hypothetical protein